MLYDTQKKVYPYDECIHLCTTLNSYICSKYFGNSQTFLENLGEIPHTGLKSVGSKRVKKRAKLHEVINGNNLTKKG